MNTIAAGTSGLPRIVFALALVQCLLAPIPHVTALGNLVTYAQLGCVLALAYQRRGALPWRDPIVVLVGLLSLYFVVASAVGPYPLDSLNSWRKDFLPVLLVFVALWLTVTSHRQVRAVLLAVAAGAGLRLLVIAIEVWILHKPLYGDTPGYFDPYASELIPSAFYGGFALVAAIYSPIAAAILLRRDLGRATRSWLLATALGAAVLVINYGSRTPLITLAAGFSILFVTRFNRRMVLTISALAVLFASYVHWQKPEIVGRYATLFSLQTYGKGTPGSLTMRDRLAIWSSIVEVADHRPLLGYGYGWKKLSLVVHEEGFLDRWLKEPDNDPWRTAYFEHGYGAVNPHNLGIQLYFEGGLVGLALFGGLLAALAGRSWLLFRRPEWQFHSLGILAACFLAAWLTGNVGNSLWAGEELPFVVMALLAVATPRLLAVSGHDAPRGILVIRRDNIGDLLCTTPLITALRRRYPNAWIGVLTNSYAAPALAGNPDIDETLVYEKGKHLSSLGARLKALARRIALIARLRSRPIDIALLPASGDQRSAERFAALSGAARVIRADDLPANGTHEVEASFRCATALGIDGPPPAMTLVAPAVAGVPVTPGDGPLVGLHISARKVPQRWPVERFAELARRLHAEADCRFLLFWAPGAPDDPKHPGDDDKAADLAERMAGLPFTAVPTRQLSELIAGLSICGLVICSDGGAMHIAAALGKPMVCFFGNSDAARWRPWGVPQLVLQPASRDVNDIGVDEAVSAYRQLISR